MECLWKSEIPFFDGEEPEAIKTRFVELYVKHKGRFDYEQIAKHIFKDLREPNRYFQAAAVWLADVDLAERIRVGLLKGDEVPDAGQNDLIRRTLQVADDPRAENKDRLAAIRLAGELQGLVKKSVDANPQAGAGNSKTDNIVDLLSQFGKTLPN